MGVEPGPPPVALPPESPPQGGIPAPGPATPELVPGGALPPGLQPFSPPQPSQPAVQSQSPLQPQPLPYARPLPPGPLPQSSQPTPQPQPSLQPQPSPDPQPQPQPQPSAVSEPEALLGAGTMVARGFKSSWSPDGRRLVFSDSSHRIRIAELETGKTGEPLGDGDCSDPAWSPAKDGPIAFVRQVNTKPDSQEVWLVNPDGSNARKIADGGFPSWSADGRTLYFHSRRTWQLMALRTDDAQAQPKPLLEVRAYYPAVSPEGTHVAYGQGKSLAVVEIATKKIVRTWPTPGWTGHLAAWSPDGRSIAFGSYGGDPGNGLWVLDLRTGRARLALRGPYTMPCWSADGKRLACDWRRGEEHIEIFDAEPLLVGPADAAAP